ncbi:MAG TPA: hypothetical protein VJT09_12050 [Pyrinomonadaceae bacterium]|nr:hypothetical protein [Pyrinomonadaceae bacterium]
MRVKPDAKTAQTFILRAALLSLCAAATIWAAPPSPAYYSGAASRVAEQGPISTIRGKLVRRGKGRTRPASYVGVTVATTDRKTRSVPVYTDAEGMYYIDVPPGQYILEIWGGQKQVILSYNIDVPDVQYFDVAPITIP